jgi:pyruvate,water dikinase
LKKLKISYCGLIKFGLEDVPIVGGKNASLGEMIQQLVPKGINVPSGFATTAHAYRHFHPI